MFIEAFLKQYMRAVTRRHMGFGTTEPPAIPQSQDNRTYLLYIHIPFCEELCPYCSFNRYKYTPDLAGEYFRCLQKEILLYHKLGYRFKSAYIGGGTPTIVPQQLRATVNLIRDLWSIESLSTETNPNHLVPEITSVLQEIGVDRLSVGVQTFNDSLLTQMGRLSRYGNGRAIQRNLKAVAGLFETLNVDIMYNLPSQTDSMLTRDLDILKELNIDQVTFYPLMLDDKTRKKLILSGGNVSHQQEKRFYDHIVGEMTGVYHRATVWCFARNGPNRVMVDEYIADHDEYAGLGAGSLGYIDGTVYANTFSIARYINNIKGGRLPITAYRRFSKLHQVRYDFLMKLFAGRINLDILQEKYGHDYSRHLWKELLFFRHLKAITHRDRYLELTPRGYFYWSVLMREFFTAVNNFRAQNRALDRRSPADKLYQNSFISESQIHPLTTP